MDFFFLRLRLAFWKQVKYCDTQIRSSYLFLFYRYFQLYGLFYWKIIWVFLEATEKIKQLSAQVIMSWTEIIT